MSYFKALKQQLSTYLSNDKIAKVEEAYQCALQAHSGQTRSSGEPYVTHPVAVATLLAAMRLDAETIMAALLHDVIEDTGVDKLGLVTQFGESVASLVDGVTKLTQIKFESRAEAQAENFRKMVLAMTKDIRVILVKLADRLHNMRTLGSLNTVKRRRIALETLEIYAPIAHRLGIYSIYQEFETLGFKAYYPMRYHAIENAVQHVRQHRRKMIVTLEKNISSALMKGLSSPSRLTGREQSLYSIYKIMRARGIPFSPQIDIYSFHIIVNDVDSCYRALGILHGLYKPIVERFKDYIAIPKVNGYQALHTVLFCPIPVLIQIRTIEMDRLAEYGIAAHWIFRDVATSAQDAQNHAQKWLHNLVELQQNTGNSIEFIENVKTDLFPDGVYVFSPKGKIFELPKGATPVDFAYAVHSDIGNTCIAAKLDHQIVPLSTPLLNGQTVEIITAKEGRPNQAWLSFVVTGKARSHIRHSLNKQQSEESILLGQRLLSAAIAQPVQQIKKEKLKSILDYYHYHDLNQLLENIGLGNHLAAAIAKRFYETEQTPVAATENSPHALRIRGSEGMIVRYADCCCPIPGDEIIAELMTGSGLKIHSMQCNKITGFQSHPEKFIPVYWEAQVEGEFRVDLIAEVANHRGALAEVAQAVANAEANIENVSVVERDGQYHLIALTIGVNDRLHLAKILRRIRAVKVVAKVARKRLEKSTKNK